VRFATLDASTQRGGYNNAEQILTFTILLFFFAIDILEPTI